MNRLMCGTAVVLAAVALSAGMSQAQLGPRFMPGETGNRYELCYAVEAGGRPVVMPGADSSCKLLEFARQDCEGQARSSHDVTFSRGPCVAFRKDDVRLKAVPATPHLAR